MRCVTLIERWGHCPPMLAKQIGKNIQVARKARGWSLEQLAAAVEPETSHQQISRLENGERTLSVQWIERIANALRLDPLDLIDNRNRASTPTLRLDEQVATEVARTLAVVALHGGEPANGTVQALSLMLQELLATFAEHPQAATDAQVARPVVALASRRYAPAKS